MATVLEVQESDARKLLQELDFSNAKSVSAKKLVSMLTDLPESVDEEDADLSTKSKKVFNRITEALADERKIKIAETNGHADEEEEEVPAKKAKKAPAKKKAAAKKKAKDEDDEEEVPKKKGKKPAAKKRSGGGPRPKELIFEKWIKDPSKTKKSVTKLAEQYDSVQENTIRSWISAWGRNDNLPAIAKGREKEVKAAIKKLKG